MLFPHACSSLRLDSDVGQLGNESGIKNFHQFSKFLTAMLAVAPLLEHIAYL